MPTGRPTDYRPEYCDLVVEVMSTGLSLSAFAGRIGVCRDTINHWMRDIPEFFVAATKGKAKRAEYLEAGMLERDMPGPAINARRFALVNAAPEEWREKQSVEHSGPNGGPIDVSVVHRVMICGPQDDIV